MITEKQTFWVVMNEEGEYLKVNGYNPVDWQYVKDFYLAYHFNEDSARSYADKYDGMAMRVEATYKIV
jgi:hypothetical protein